MKHALLTVLSGILFVTATHFSLGDAQIQSLVEYISSLH